MYLDDIIIEYILINCTLFTLFNFLTVFCFVLVRFFGGLRVFRIPWLKKKEEKKECKKEKHDAKDLEMEKDGETMNSG